MFFSGSGLFSVAERESFSVVLGVLEHRPISVFLDLPRVIHLYTAIRRLFLHEPTSFLKLVLVLFPSHYTSSADALVDLLGLLICCFFSNISYLAFNLLCRTNICDLSVTQLLLKLLLFLQINWRRRYVIWLALSCPALARDFRPVFGVKDKP